MPLSDDFSAVAAPPENPKPGRKRRLPPFSLRLSEAERARLAADAAGAPLGAYVKLKLFDGMAVGRKRRKGIAVEDRQALAQALALLGRSRLSSNLSQLAQAASIGVLPVTPETETYLLETLEDVRDIRRLLLTGLGRESGGSA